MQRKITLLFLLCIAILIVFFLSIHKRNTVINASPTPTSIPTPTPTPFTHYQIPKLENKKVYNVVLVGDSMTHALGPHGGRLLDYLQAKFVGKGFIIDNYAYSTNITSLPNFLTQETKTWDLTFQPILKRDFDVIIIESFGYNPLSDLSTQVGLERQTSILDQSLTQLLSIKPSAVIVFMATLAPNKELYAKNVVKQPEQQRLDEVNERISYIKSFMNYASSHGIPLVDVFDKSMVNGDGNAKYINPDDYIHPSVDGIELISDTITNSLWDQNLIPH